MRLQLPRAIRTLPLPVKIAGSVAMGVVAYRTAGVPRLAAGSAAGLLIGSAVVPRDNPGGSRWLAVAAMLPLIPP